MSYRRFKDADGRTWEAWEVHPAAIERRLQAERRRAPRDETNRRRHFDVRLVIPPALQAGWLALEGSSTKIRLAPIPSGWMALSDEDLAELVEHAARSRNGEGRM
jgi:hypothetical protein